MLLPHGYEGQGPEHSSARIERYLQLCAEDNLQVANCTTPAQYFHLLRRQMRRNWRAPLVVFTPKSLLRAPRCTSSVAELAGGGFRPVIEDAAIRDGAAVQRVLLCSGKVYYDLVARREQRDELGEGKARGDVAIVRVEELYPWPDAELGAALAKLPKAAHVVWVQEEPANMGSWTFVRERLQALLPPRAKLAYAGRREAASPAVGSARVHRLELEEFLRAAFGG
jgi:2-oxoglutarate dehydrogenase E1 component